MEQINKISITKQFVYAFIFSILFLGFSACKEAPLNVGFLLIESDRLSFADTILPVELQSVQGDPYNSFSIGYSPLGSIKDPVFGEVKTDFIGDLNYYNQINYANFKETDTTGLEVVDLELRLYYSVLYGNFNDLTFKVFELTKTVPDSMSSNYKIEADMYNPQSIKISNPRRVNVSSSVHYISVKLSKEYANKFIDTSSYVRTSFQMDKDSASYRFKKIFKGLYIKTEYRSALGEGGAIAGIRNNDTATSSRLVLRTKLKINGIATTDIFVDNFYLGNPTVPTHLNIPYCGPGKHINMYSSILTPEIKGIDDTLNYYPEVYIQAFSGPKVLLKIPELQSLREAFNYKVVIQKAELILPIAKDYLSNIYKAPTLIGIRDASNNKLILDDMLLYSSSAIYNTLGGNYDTISYAYKLNLGNHIQHYMQDKTENSFGDQFYVFAADYKKATSSNSILVTDYAFQTAGRVILFNTNETKAPYIRIVYSKILK